MCGLFLYVCLSAASPPLRGACLSLQTSCLSPLWSWLLSSLICRSALWTPGTSLCLRCLLLWVAFVLCMVSIEEKNLLFFFFTMVTLTIFSFMVNAFIGLRKVSFLVGWQGGILLGSETLTVSPFALGSLTYRLLTFVCGMKASPAHSSFSLPDTPLFLLLSPEAWLLPPASSLQFTTPGKFPSTLLWWFYIELKKNSNKTPQCHLFHIWLIFVFFGI